MALTATANRQTVEDIVRKLDITGCKRFTMSFNRVNLYYEVCAKGNDASTVKDIVHFIKTNFPSQTGIIYYNNRDKCDKLANNLREQHGLNAASYHAELGPEIKEALQRDWQSGKIHVIVATVRVFSL